jgi:hypothetical protein
MSWSNVEDAEVVKSLNRPLAETSIQATAPCQFRTHQNFSIIQESQSNISYNGLHELSLFGKKGKLM